MDETPVHVKQSGTQKGVYERNISRSADAVGLAAVKDVGDEPAGSEGEGGYGPPLRHGTEREADAFKRGAEGYAGDKGALRGQRQHELPVGAKVGQHEGEGGGMVGEHCKVARRKVASYERGGQGRNPCGRQPRQSQGGPPSHLETVGRRSQPFDACIGEDGCHGRVARHAEFLDPAFVSTGGGWLVS